MQPEMIRQLQDLQAQAHRLGALAAGLSEAAPDHATGSDATGWVTAVLDRAGRPVELRVRNGWDQRLEAARLGPAVGEACADAVRQGMQAWEQSLDDSRWHQRRNAYSDGGDPGDAPPPRLPFGEPREVTEIAEEVIARLEAARRQPVPGPERAAEGADDERHVAITFEAGGAVACTVDQRWAARNTGDTITAALSTALGRARTTLGAAPPPPAGVDGLIGDVLATLAAFNNQ